MVRQPQLYYSSRIQAASNYWQTLFACPQCFHSHCVQALAVTLAPPSMYFSSTGFVRKRQKGVLGYHSSFESGDRTQVRDEYMLVEEDPEPAHM
jgi:hypothetical protein